MKRPVCLNGTGPFWWNIILLVSWPIVFFTWIWPNSNRHDVLADISILIIVGFVFAWRICAFRLIMFDEERLYIKSYFPRNTESIALKDVVSYERTSSQSHAAFRYCLVFRIEGRTESRTFFPDSEGSDLLEEYLSALKGTGS